MKRRTLQIYNQHEQKKLHYQKKMVLYSIKLMALNLSTTGKLLLYNNQDSCAALSSSLFIDLQIIAVLVLGLTQSGKTGAMLATIKTWLKAKAKTHRISTENIYIITGLSSKEWVRQTTSRLPVGILDRIFHRNVLMTPKFMNDIKGKKNVLIIMDEVQVAAKTKQTVYKAFKQIGLLDKNYLLKNDIKIIEFSATPDGVLCNLKDWGAHHKIIKLRPGEGYVSAKDLLDQGRVKQYKNLYGYNQETKEVSEAVINNIKKIKSDIEQFDRHNRGPLYHIIRTKNGAEQDVTIRTFEAIFGEENYCYTRYDHKHKTKEDINDILKNKPPNHTFIFIKEMQRCAKTLFKKHIGIVYERWIKSTTSDSVIIQGLLGRMTGYDDNKFSIVYTNQETIRNYFKYWDCNFQPAPGVKIKWTSSTTVNRNGEIVADNRGTYHDPKHIMGMAEDNVEQSPPPKMFMESFGSEEEARNHFDEELREKLGRTSNGNLRQRPQKTKKNEEGFPVFRGLRRLIVDMDADPQLEKSYGHSHNLNKSNGSSWLIPCYGDITDKDTIEWRLYYLIKNA